MVQKGQGSGPQPLIAGRGCKAAATTITRVTTTGATAVAAAAAAAAGTTKGGETIPLKVEVVLPLGLLHHGSTGWAPHGPRVEEGSGQATGHFPPQQCPSQGKGQV